MFVADRNMTDIYQSSKVSPNKSFFRKQVAASRRLTVKFTDVKLLYDQNSDEDDDFNDLEEQLTGKNLMVS